MLSETDVLLYFFIDNTFDFAKLHKKDETSKRILDFYLYSNEDNKLFREKAHLYKVYSLMYKYQ